MQHQHRRTPGAGTEEPPGAGATLRLPLGAGASDPPRIPLGVGTANSLRIPPGAPTADAVPL